MVEDRPAVYSAVIEGVPVPKGRPRFSARTGRAYTPAKTLTAEAWVAQHFKLQNIGAGDPPYIPMPATVRVILVFRVPSEITDTVGVADLDNLVKLVLDALNGLAWEDDRQVVTLRAHVLRGSDRAETVIKVEELRDE